MDAENRRAAATLAAVGAFLALAWYGRSALGLEWNAESVRETVAGYGVWGPLVFILLMGFRYVFLVPSQILLVAAGLIFGVALGTLYGALGLLISGSTAFAVARYAGREAVLSSVPENMRWAFSAAGSRAGALAVVVSTGYPIGPMGAFHAGAGLTPMSVAVFLPALAGGALIRAGTYAWFGSAILEGDWRLLGAAGVLLLAAAAPLVHPRGRAWLRRKFAGQEPDRAPSRRAAR